VLVHWVGVTIAFTFCVIGTNILVHNRHCVHYHQALPASSDEDETVTRNNPPDSAATVSVCIDDVNEDDDLGRSDFLTVLIKSDPIAAAAVMNASPSEPQSSQQEFEVH